MIFDNVKFYCFRFDLCMKNLSDLVELLWYEYCCNCSFKLSLIENVWIFTYTIEASLLLFKFSILLLLFHILSISVILSFLLSWSILFVVSFGVELLFLGEEWFNDIFQKVSALSVVYPTFLVWFEYNVLITYPLFQLYYCSSSILL